MLKWSLIVIAAHALLAGGLALADAAGERELKVMDGVMTRAKDQLFTYDMVTKEPGKAERVLTMRVRVKGTKWRLVEFMAPGDVKGMKVLVLSQSKMYVYLPAYRKVRRVASHVKDQGFMGTTYSHDDISTVTYADYYTAKLVKQTPTHKMLAATRRKGADVPYARIEFDVLKKYGVPSEIRYFNAKGTKIKTELRLSYSCQGDICNAAEMKMTDHVRNGAWTKMLRKKWKTNTGVSDSKFSLRALQRGR